MQSIESAIKFNFYSFSTSQRLNSGSFLINWWNIGVESTNKIEGFLIAGGAGGDYWYSIFMAQLFLYFMTLQWGKVKPKKKPIDLFKCRIVMSAIN